MEVLCAWPLYWSIVMLIMECGRMLIVTREIDAAVYVYVLLAFFILPCNDNQIDLQERIKNANKTYFMLQQFFKK